MSLYWKNKDKPRSCERCDFSRRLPRKDGQILFCYAANKFVEKTEGISDYINYEECPFDEVATPHGDLIDRDKLIKTLRKNYCYSGVYDNCLKKNGCMQCMLNPVLTYLKEAPTIIGVEQEKEQ